MLQYNFVDILKVSVPTCEVPRLVLFPVYITKFQM